VPSHTGVEPPVLVLLVELPLVVELALVVELVVVVLEVDVELVVALVAARPPVPPVPPDPEPFEDAPPVLVVPPINCPSAIPKMALHAESRPPQSTSASTVRHPPRETSNKKRKVA